METPTSQVIRSSLVPLKEFTHDPESSGSFAPFCPLAFLLSPDQSGRWLVGAVGIESTNCLEIKEFCGATWPSKVLNGKRGNFWCPLNAPSPISK